MKIHKFNKESIICSGSLSPNQRGHLWHPDYNQCSEFPKLLTKTLLSRCIPHAKIIQFHCNAFNTSCRWMRTICVSMLGSLEHKYKLNVCVKFIQSRNWDRMFVICIIYCLVLFQNPFPTLPYCIQTLSTLFLHVFIIYCPDLNTLSDTQCDPCVKKLGDLSYSPWKKSLHFIWESIDITTGYVTDETTAPRGMQGLKSTDTLNLKTSLSHYLCCILHQPSDLLHYISASVLAKSTDQLGETSFRAPDGPVL